MEENKRFESIYSSKVRAGKRRTYFFDVRKTKSEDYYITITESTKKFQGDGYERHKIFLYKEDFNRFMSSMQDVVDHVKTELMPDFDYELYEKRQKEWEEKMAEEAALAESTATSEETTETTTEEASPAEEAAEEVAEDVKEEVTEDVKEESEKSVDSEEDMSW